MAGMVTITTTPSTRSWTKKLSTLVLGATKWRRDKVRPADTMMVANCPGCFTISLKVDCPGKRYNLIPHYFLGKIFLFVENVLILKAKHGIMQKIITLFNGT